MTGIDFGKNVSGLPMGAWIAAGAGVLGLYFWRSKQAAAAATNAANFPATNTSADPGVGAGGWIATNAPLNDPSTVSTAPTTNDAWATKAITWLIAQGYDPGVSDGAIRNYINAQTLTTQQQALVNLALKQFGAPPEAMVPAQSNPAPIGGGVTTGTTPPPVQTPPPPPPVQNTPPPPVQTKPVLRYVTVTPWPGTPYDSLAKIARAFYGNDNAWPTLYNANRAGFTRPDGSAGWITNPSVIYPGRSIYVP